MAMGFADLSIGKPHKETSNNTELVDLLLHVLLEGPSNSPPNYTDSLYMLERCNCTTLSFLLLASRLYTNKTEQEKKEEEEEEEEDGPAATTSPSPRITSYKYISDFPL
jgi:hypothetical protein